VPAVRLDPMPYPGSPGDKGPSGKRVPARRPPDQGGVPGRGFRGRGPFGPAARQDDELNAESKDAAGGSIAASARTCASAWGAPRVRSMPASSHSTEIGPS
jgi:hypothetical protein